MNEKTIPTNGETYFFRDHGQFDLLRLRLVPELIQRRTPEKSLRLWSAGCASGEEAYSLAMLVDMLLPNRSDWNVLIIGSDINPAALAKARLGRYGSWSFRALPPNLKHRYFRQDGEAWTLDEAIRDMVNFRGIDLIKTPFPDNQLRDMDLVLCRNVFIYFDADTVTAVANKLAASIREGGYLMTGHAELTASKPRDMQSRLFAESVVYQRLAPQPPVPAPPPIERMPPPPPKETCQRPRMPAPEEPNTEELLASARILADRGEYDSAEQCCQRALSLGPLKAEPYFLLAQMAQLKGDFGRAIQWLEKTLYLDPGCVAASLELAALYERAENLPRARALRRSALETIRSLPADETIEPYETTAKDFAQWLAR